MSTGNKVNDIISSLSGINPTLPKNTIYTLLTINDKLYSNIEVYTDIDEAIASLREIEELSLPTDEEIISEINENGEFSIQEYNQMEDSGYEFTIEKHSVEI